MTASSASDGHQASNSFQLNNLAYQTLQLFNDSKKQPDNFAEIKTSLAENKEKQASSILKCAYEKMANSSSINSQAPKTPISVPELVNSSSTSSFATNTPVSRTKGLTLGLPFTPPDTSLFWSNINKAKDNQVNGIGLKSSSNSKSENETQIPSQLKSSPTSNRVQRPKWHRSKGQSRFFHAKLNDSHALRIRAKASKLYSQYGHIEGEDEMESSEVQEDAEDIKPVAFNPEVSTVALNSLDFISVGREYLDGESKYIELVDLAIDCLDNLSDLSLMNMRESLQKIRRYSLVFIDQMTSESTNLNHLAEFIVFSEKLKALYLEYISVFILGWDEYPFPCRQRSDIEDLLTLHAEEFGADSVTKSLDWLLKRPLARLRDYTSIYKKLMNLPQLSGFDEERQRLESAYSTLYSLLRLARLKYTEEYKRLRVKKRKGLICEDGLFNEVKFPQADSLAESFDLSNVYDIVSLEPFDYSLNLESEELDRRVLQRQIVSFTMVHSHTKAVIAVPKVELILLSDLLLIVCVSDAPEYQPSKLMFPALSPATWIILNEQRDSMQLEVFAREKMSFSVIKSQNPAGSTEASPDLREFCDYLHGVQARETERAAHRMTALKDNNKSNDDFRNSIFEGASIASPRSSFSRSTARMSGPNKSLHSAITKSRSQIKVPETLMEIDEGDTFHEEYEEDDQSEQTLKSSVSSSFQKKKKAQHRLSQQKATLGMQKKSVIMPRAQKSMKRLSKEITNKNSFEGGWHPLRLNSRHSSMSSSQTSTTASTQSCSSSVRGLDLKKTKMRRQAGSIMSTPSKLYAGNTKESSQESISQACNETSLVKSTVSPTSKAVVIEPKTPPRQTREHENYVNLEIDEFPPRSKMPSRASVLFGLPHPNKSPLMESPQKWARASIIFDSSKDISALATKLKVVNLSPSRRAFGSPTSKYERRRHLGSYSNTSPSKVVKFKPQMELQPENHLHTNEKSYFDRSFREITKQNFCRLFNIKSRRKNKDSSKSLRRKREDASSPYLF